MNIQLLELYRVGFFRNAAKQQGQKWSTIENDGEIIVIDTQSTKVIKDRLIESTGKQKNCFKLEIENTSEGSFYDLAETALRAPDERAFLSSATSIAEHLAGAQTRTNIPGGYILVIHAKEHGTHINYLIVIKAELQEALRKGKNAIEALADLFLSPSQRLFKIGIIFEKDVDRSKSPNERYGAVVCDNQLSSGKPSEFFYKDFLGYSVKNNGAIQTLGFYKAVETFTKVNVHDTRTQENLLMGLKSEILSSQNSFIVPEKFAEEFVPKDLQDDFLNFTSQEFPDQFNKDSSLLTHQLQYRIMDFPAGIKLKGKEEEFEKRVKVISSRDELLNLDPEDNNFTILKISGRPYGEPR